MKEQRCRIELSEEYAEIAARRLSQEILPLETLAAAAPAASVPAESASLFPEAA